ncbi:MAG: NhaA family Na+:H+ antiporter [Gammaproteobacteria bacterium]
MTKKKGFINFLQEFSIPLIAGVLSALVFANISPETYHHFVDFMPFKDLKVFGHDFTLHFLVNDIFMVFFFGIAAKEITESILPGGALNPMSKAINPLFATIGGVVGPIAVFFILVKILGGMGSFGDVPMSEVNRGWGVPTATDIALAWLVARGVFGPGHPAVNFLLLLAVADDAIGLGIIAIFYGDPAYPAEPKMLLLVLLGMVVAFVLRKLQVQKWQPYIFVAGPLAWAGLMMAHLHPALALVFIVPFLPGPKRDTGLFVEADEVDQKNPAASEHHNHGDHSPLHCFEHDMKLFVDLGLFFFAFANAGVELAGIGTMTWVILGSLVIGKTLGVTLLGLLARMLGFPLPARMGLKHLAMAGFIAALGLTVALFVCAQAFPGNEELLGQAKMGALFSGFVGVVAIPLGKMLKMRES